MRIILAALFFAAGIGLAAPGTAGAAPANGAAIANALKDTSLVETVACRRVCNWRRCWTTCRRPAPVFVAPPIIVPPVYVAPVCRSVRVCDWRGCWWRRIC